MRMSVIIPTRNRHGTLSRCLECLTAQDCPLESFEVVVVDDGSSDETWAWLQTYASGSPFPVRPFRQPPRGPAAARNRGLEAAQGELVVFLGDDIYASPGLLSRHLAWHAAWPDEWTAVLGQIQWAPDLRVSSLMRWLETSGAQWRFQGLEAGNSLTYHWFITANLSLKRAVLLETGAFDERFPNAALEDTELGYRLSLRGLQIRYAADALAYHWHPVALEGFLERSRKQGRGAIYCTERWPELRPELLEPMVWFADYPRVVRRTLSHLVRWRWFIAVLFCIASRFADQPPGPLQPWASRVYWLLVYHYRLLGSASV